MPKAHNQEKAKEAAVYAANMILAENAWDNGHPLGAQKYLEPFRNPVEKEKDLRGWEWHFQDRLCHSELSTFQGSAETVNGMAFSADGKTLFTAGETLSIWDMAARRRLKVLEKPPLPFGALTLSFDGKRMAAVGPGKKVTVWEGPDWKILAETPGHSDSIQGVAFSPDGQHLAFGGPAMR